MESRCHEKRLIFVEWFAVAADNGPWMPIEWAAALFSSWCIVLFVQLCQFSARSIVEGSKVPKKNGNPRGVPAAERFVGKRACSIDSVTALSRAFGAAFCHNSMRGAEECWRCVPSPDSRMRCYGGLATIALPRLGL
ncbi:hypothetical protein MRX96_021192 [Rhipicephalus microplus]